ncbi:MAG: aldo/keto reductase [Promethearchaeota archaeon]
MRYVQLGKTSVKIPIVGQGTWRIKSKASESFYKTWKEALKYGIEQGLTLIDTAEVYGYGKSEKIVGEVIKEYDRDKLFIATKVFPHHFGFKGTIKACNRSLKNLGIDTIDLYQLHWPIPWSSLKNTFRAMEQLVREEKIRFIGVSNFWVKRIIKSNSLLKENKIVSNQIQMSIKHPSSMKRQLLWARENGVTLIAWSPFGHYGLKKLNKKLEAVLREIADNRGITLHQVALSWLTSNGVVVIPKSTNKKHIKANAEVADIILSKDEIKSINEALKLKIQI